MVLVEPDFLPLRAELECALRSNVGGLGAELVVVFQRISRPGGTGPSRRQPTDGKASKAPPWCVLGNARQIGNLLRSGGVIGAVIAEAERVEHPVGRQSTCARP